MSEAAIMDIMRLTIETAVLISCPLIVTILIVGVATQVLQSVTQLKDQAISFVPKVLATGVVFVLAVPWYIQTLQKYVDFIFNLIEKAAQ